MSAPRSVRLQKDIEGCFPYARSSGELGGATKPETGSVVPSESCRPEAEQIVWEAAPARPLTPQDWFGCRLRDQEDEMDMRPDSVWNPWLDSELKQNSETMRTSTRMSLFFFFFLNWKTVSESWKNVSSTVFALVTMQWPETQLTSKDGS